MCWVAIERAIRLATRRGLPAGLERWRKASDAIYRRIMDRGWSPTLKAFVHYEGGDVVDAAVLLMPLVKFISPTDPKWLSTLNALTASLVSDSLVYRYNPRASPDGVRGAEGTFSACSFWYVEALTRAGRWTRRGWRSRRCSATPTTWACMPSRSAAPDSSKGTSPGADPPGADQRRVQPRPCPRRVNHQDLVMTAHLPGGEARFVAEGSHGHEGTPGNTRRSEPPVNPARFTYE